MSTVEISSSIATPRTKLVSETESTLRYDVELYGGLLRTRSRRLVVTLDKATGRMTIRTHRGQPVNSEMQSRYEPRIRVAIAKLNQERT